MSTLCLPRIVDLRVTGACMLRCPFCFGPPHEYPEAADPAFLDLFPKLRALGVEGLVFTGGEPLLFAPLPEWLRIAKSQGFITILSTNGLLLEDKLPALAPYLDWVGLPIDGDSPDVVSSMRPRSPSSYLGILLGLLHLLRTKHPSLRTKVQTVVSRLNMESIRGIPRLLAEAGAPTTWKMTQVACESEASNNWKLLRIGPMDFYRVTRTAAREADRFGLSWAVFPRRKRNRRYLFIQPTGEVTVVAGGRERSIGNALTDLEQVARAWTGLVTPSSMSRRTWLTAKRAGVEAKGLA